jgi:hypothetical protein
MMPPWQAAAAFVFAWTLLRSGVRIHRDDIKCLLQNDRQHALRDPPEQTAGRAIVSCFRGAGPPSIRANSFTVR